MSLLIVALLLGFALGGASLVMAAGGTITACVNQQGIFRLLTVGSCTQNETSITWNQTGPQGPAGPQGATGPVGPQGPAGQPGGGLATTVLNTGGEIPTGATGVVVSTLNLPAGSYSILGRVSVSGTFLFNGTVPAGTDLAVSCNLVAGSDTDTERVSTFVPPVPGDSQVIGNITLSVLHTFTAPASATITCRGDSDPAGLESSRITAVQVTSIQ